MSDYISKMSVNNAEYEVKDNGARELIEGLATVVSTGNYEDLDGKPVLNFDEAGAAAGALAEAKSYTDDAVGSIDAIADEVINNLFK